MIGTTHLLLSDGEVLSSFAVCAILLALVMYCRYVSIVVSYFATYFHGMLRLCVYTH